MKACTLFTSDNEVAEDWLGKFNSREPLDIYGQKYLIDEISTDYEPGFSGATIKMYPIFQAKSPERPKKQEAWGGEGLPPVGTVCEYQSMVTCGEWTQVEILIHVDTGVAKAAVFLSPSKVVKQAIADCFRQIKTAEQVAAEEREKAIADMMEVTSDGISCIGQDDALALYKAGYRKQ